MNKRRKRPFHKRIAIDIAGFGLLFAALLTGWLPGPTGIPLFLAGLGLLSLNYEWAERLLKDFDDRRREYTDKYLMTSRKVSWVIDLISISVFGAGVALAIVSDSPWLKGLGFALCFAAAMILISNQKRLERFISTVKK